MSEPAKAVFVSYASQDAEAARQICEALRSGGVEVWLDADGGLEHGDEWDAKIRRQIKECVLFIPIISANTQAREEGYFRIEWDLAAERARGIASGVPFILPVVIDGTHEGEALVPERFRHVQWTWLPGGVVTPEVQQRFLKLWSHRTGVLKHQAAAAAPSNPAGASPTRRRGPLLAALATGIVALAATVFVLQRSPAPAPKPPADSTPGPAPASNQQEPTTARASTAKAEALGVKPNSDRSDHALGEESYKQSVAVLPFANQSEDKANEYFSDGIAEELLTVLQKIPGLRVAARTSAWTFKQRGATAQEVGEKLGVAHIVEGSVQKSGSRVKITARLSRATSNEELWSRSFGPLELTDVFATQSEIAQAIVGELRGRLTGDGAATTKAEIQAQVQAASRGGTRHPEAYQSYLEGIYFLNQFSAENFVRAERVLQRAIDQDSAFALAWVALSRAAAGRGEFASTRRDLEEGFALARRAADRALALEPQLASAHVARMSVQRAYDFDWTGAQASLRRAQELAPHDATVVAAAADLALAFGQNERAVELARQAVALDPLNTRTRNTLGFALEVTGRYPEAEAEFRRIVELNPSAIWGYAALGEVNLRQGRFEEAVRLAGQEATGWSRLVVQAQAWWGLGKKREADEALRELTQDFAETAAFQVAQVHAYRGDADRAFEWLERAYQQRDSGIAWCRPDLTLTRVHRDPRWPAFLKKVGLSDERLK